MDDVKAESDEELEDKETQSKNRGWSRLRTKIHEFRRRQTSPEFNDNTYTAPDGGISDFLYSTAQLSNEDGSRLQPPQIDLSVAKASDTQQVDFGIFQFSKPPRAIGLKVAFVGTTPEVIGIGGEDSEEPVTAVSRRHFTAPIYLPQKASAHQTDWNQFFDNSAKQPPANVLSAQKDSAKSSKMEAPHSSALSQKHNMASSPKYSQMRADEGRALLFPSAGNGKELRRKPVASSDSESTSRSRSPAQSHHASPPPSRGSDDGILHAPQYPKALRPAHLQNVGCSGQRLPEPTQFRPSSSGSESNSRGRLRRMGPTTDLRAEPANSQDISPSPTSHPLATRERTYSPSSGIRPSNEAKMSSAERLEPPPDSRPRSSPNRSSNGLEDENCIFRSHLRSLGIAKLSTANDNVFSLAQAIPWNRVHVFNVPAQDEENKTTIRVIAFDERSSFKDESIRPGKFKLDKSQLTTLTLSRQPSSAARISISPQVRDDFLVSQLKQAQSTLNNSPTSLAFHFRSRTETRTFQEAVTGYSVRYDGIAPHFSISRRRTMVSMHKSYDAANVRLQILQGHGRTHLVAFFSEYALADCLQFELRSFDVFEVSESKDELFLVKFVDAKFSLPDPHIIEKPQFVALDSMEPTSEHEDIFIGFTEETARDELSAQLPAAVSEPRKFTLKRRI